jgi:hypothetical protein
MWKTLTIITILLAGAGATFRYLNTEDAKLEKTLLERSVANRTAVEDRLDEVVQNIDDFNDQGETTRGEAEQEATNLATAKTQLSDKNSMKTQIEGQIAEKTAQLDALKESTAKFGPIEELVAKSEALSLETNTVSQELLSATEKFKSLVATRASTQTRITSLKERETMIKEAKMTDLSTRISQSFGDWGFVVISAGATQGVNARAILDVKRGSDTIAQLQVTNLEKNVAVCDVVNQVDGQSVSVGDRVVVSEESKWDPAKSAAAAAGGADPAGDAAAPAPAPAPAPDGAGDPFGLEAPSDPAPAGDDPFGLGGDTDPAPEAEAPAGDDPFGLN